MSSPSPSQHFPGNLTCNTVKIILFEILWFDEDGSCSWTLEFVDFQIKKVRHIEIPKAAPNDIPSHIVLPFVWTKVHLTC